MSDFLAPEADQIKRRCRNWRDEAFNIAHEEPRLRRVLELCMQLEFRVRALEEDCEQLRTKLRGD